MLADNRIAELAEWDRELLADELQELMTLDLELTTEAIGFEVPELDILFEEAAEKASSGQEDEIPPPATTPPVSRRGDLWLMGPHRVICGDARDEAVYKALLGDERAGMVFTDPPYNVAISSVTGRGETKHAEFAFASGEMTEPEFIDFLAEALARPLAYSRPGALHYVCMDDLHGYELMVAARRLDLRLFVTCVWAKTNGGMGSTYRKQCEFVHVFRAGRAPSVNNVQLGRYGRNRTTLWSYAGVNSFRKGRMEDLGAHPTVKPVALVSDAIKDASRSKDIVLDPFCGSGTTIVAAERTGRRGRGIEYEPAYVDVIVRRWQALTGKAAVHAETGLTFEEMAEARATSAEDLATLPPVLLTGEA
jgi:DNA modification methylase